MEVNKPLVNHGFSKMRFRCRDAICNQARLSITADKVSTSALKLLSKNSGVTDAFISSFYNGVTEVSRSLRKILLSTAFKFRKV